MGFQAQLVQKTHSYMPWIKISRTIENLKLLPPLETLGQFFNGLRLIPPRLEFRYQLKGRSNDHKQDAVDAVNRSGNHRKINQPLDEF